MAAEAQDGAPQPGDDDFAYFLVRQALLAGCQLKGTVVVDLGTPEAGWAGSEPSVLHFVDFDKQAGGLRLNFQPLGSVVERLEEDTEMVAAIIGSYVWWVQKQVDREDLSAQEWLSLLFGII